MIEKESEKEEKLEPIRDEAEKVLRQAERTWALKRGIADKSSFTRRDLGIERLLEVQQAQDNGVVGEDIQKAINNLENKKSPSKGKLYVAKVLSRGFYNYLKFRRFLGMPKDSFTIGKLKGGNLLPDCLGLVNPGGLVCVKEGDYTLTANLELKTGVALNGAGRGSTKILTDSPLTQLILVNKKMLPNIKDIFFDCNNTALCGIDYRDSWHSDIRAKIFGVPTNGVGLKVQADDVNYLALWNKFNVYIESYAYTNGGAIATGSYGIKIDSSVAPTGVPNMNEFTGKATGFNYGVYIKEGGQQLFRHFDSGACNWCYYINTVDNVFIDCYEESGVNAPLITKTGRAIIIGGYWETAPTKESDASASGHLIRLHPDYFSLGSQYHAGMLHPTPPIEFSQGGNYTVNVYGRGDGAIIEFANADNAKARARIYVGTAGEFRILRGSDEVELGGLTAGTSSNRPVLKMWDVTLAAYRYAYIDNGAWVIDAAAPT